MGLSSKGHFGIALTVFRTSRRQYISIAGPTVCKFPNHHTHVVVSDGRSATSSEAVAGFEGTGRPGRSRLGGTYAKQP